MRIFEQEKAGLEAERRTVGQCVAVATRRGDDVQENVLYWEEEADKLIQEDTKTKQKCFFGFCHHCILRYRYRREKELAKKTEQIKRLMEKGEKIENVGLDARLPDVERYSSQHYISFKGRDSKHKELLDALKDDNNYITGLQLMGGTSKTTLAKEVGTQLKQSKQYDQVIDTTVSFTPNIKKIQDDIAGPLGLVSDENCNESDRPKKLRGRLTNGEKILVILDDVWGHINFDEIGIPFSDNHKGCKVLITTCNLWVCNKMGCGRIIQLELLSEEDAWIMFIRHAAINDSYSKSLLDKAHKIANECKGLPIAIAALANSLKGQQRPEEWDVALNSLQKPLFSIQGVDDENLVEIYKCLKFSYDNMKDDKAKGLFLLCSIFQEDEKIPTELILTRHGVGAGLFGEDYVRYNDARCQVVVVKNKLLDSCLLLQAEKGWLRVFHFLCFDRRYDVLPAKSLPQSFQSMTNIRSLLVHRVDLGDVSILGNLQSLETLDLFDCRINELPHEITTLEKFRLLKLERCEIKRTDSFEVIKRCSSLEELYFTDSFNRFCQEISLPLLQRYHVCRRLDISNDSLSKCVVFKRDMDGDVNFSEATLKNLMQTGEVLQLNGIKVGWRNLIPQAQMVPTEEGMNDLVELNLSLILQLQYLVDSKHIESQAHTIFSELLVLRLEDMENLEELRNSPLSFDSLQNLEELLIHRCGSLRRMLKCNMFLCNLKSMKLSRCPMLASVFQLSTSRRLVLLEELQICDCEYRDRDPDVDGSKFDYFGSNHPIY